MVEKTVKQKGITVVEIVVVIAIIALLLGFGTPAFFSWLGQQKVENIAIQLYTDIKWAQSEAQKQGSYGLDNTDLTDVKTLKRKVFVDLNTTNSSYSIWRWQDDDEDGVADNGEFSPDFGYQVNSDGALKTVTDMKGVKFDLLSGINKIACSNNAGTPSGAIVNINDCPNTTTNLSGKCIIFNSIGFYEGADNAAIYLSNGKHAYAISLNVTGTLQLCRWDEDAGEWKRLR